MTVTADSESLTVALLPDFEPPAGMMGVVVEAVLQVRPRIATTSVSFCVPTNSGAVAVEKILQQYKKCDALFAIMVPDRSYIYMETRKKVGV